MFKARAKAFASQGHRNNMCFCHSVEPASRNYRQPVLLGHPTSAKQSNQSLSNLTEKVLARLEAHIDVLERRWEQTVEANERTVFTLQREIVHLKNRLSRAGITDANLEDKTTSVAAVTPGGILVCLDGSPILSQLGQAPNPSRPRAALLKLAHQRWVAGQKRSSTTRLVADHEGVIQGAEEVLEPEPLLSLAEDWREIDRALLLRDSKANRWLMEVQPPPRTKAPIAKAPPPVRAPVEQTRESAVLTPPRERSPAPALDCSLGEDVPAGRGPQSSSDVQEDAATHQPPVTVLRRGDEVSGRVTWVTNGGIFLDVGADRDGFLRWSMATIQRPNVGLGMAFSNLLVDSVDEHGRISLRGPLADFGTRDNAWAAYQPGSGALEEDQLGSSQAWGQPRLWGRGYGSEDSWWSRSSGSSSSGARWRR